MKKIFTLFIVLLNVLAISAQMPSTMRFVGNSDFSVMSQSCASSEVDTVLFQMNGMTDGNITVPAVSYMGMTIPSFTISNAPFSMGENQVVTFSEYEFSVDGVTGTVKSGSYSMATNKLDLVIDYQATGMPLTLTFTFSGYYVKAYTYKLSVTVGGIYSCNLDDITYDVRKYVENETTNIDVAMPTYVCPFGVQGLFDIGDLTVGAYTVRHLVYDESKAVYYRDFSNDGLTMYVKDANFGLDNVYNLTGDISLTYSGSDICVISNPKPGAMPFSLQMILNPELTGISEVSTNAQHLASSTLYNLAGLKVSENAKGIVIINGKKVVK